MTEDREVMDIHQAAAYLQISEDTLYKYASSLFIPAFKLGNCWRFKKSRIDEWMEEEIDKTRPQKGILADALKPLANLEAHNKNK